MSGWNFTIYWKISDHFFALNNKYFKKEKGLNLKSRNNWLIEQFSGHKLLLISCGWKSD